MLPWKLGQEHNQNTGYFLEGLNSEQYTLMSSENDYASYEQYSSQSIEYFFDEVTKEFCCPICSYKSKFKRNTIRHFHAHSGSKPFKCQYCQFSCSQKSNLKIHHRIHTGEKPHICSYCNKRFRDGSNLKQHLRVHSRE